MRALILLFCSSVVFGQSYTVYKLATFPPALPPSTLSLSATGPVLGCSNEEAQADATNGTIYVGWFTCDGPEQNAAIWFNGINNPATNLNSLNLINPDGSPASVGFTNANSIDANGNIVATYCSFDCYPNGAAYLLIPTVNPLQAQLKHMTSEMQVYRNGLVFYEAEYLAAYSKLCQAKLTKC